MLFKHYLSLLLSTILFSNIAPIYTMTSSTSHILESRLRAALWGLFSGDALAAPTHWFYGGERQVASEYGGLLTGYTKPNENLYGSIMNKSNVNGGGRGMFGKGAGNISIIGDVINHGKREYWDPRRQVHYHATLQAGENTLEAQLVRVLMKSIVANDGIFDSNHFRDAYIQFMTTPNSHNDTYASTCHRMFFANLVFKKLPPKDCPDNDGHNVDTIDGLILPTITALVAAVLGDRELGRKLSSEVVSVTRNSNILIATAKVWSDVIFDAIHQGDVENSLTVASRSLGYRAPKANKRDEISACYLDGSLPSLFDMLMKYSTNDVWIGLVANANNGGENVHRGALLGACLGALTGYENLPPQLIDGLYNAKELSNEIDEFIEALLKLPQSEL